jgi:hypothetical protein
MDATITIDSDGTPHVVLHTDEAADWFAQHYHASFLMNERVRESSEPFSVFGQLPEDIRDDMEAAGLEVSLRRPNYW